MTKKLKLPLMIISAGAAYALSKGTTGVDLTSAGSGSVYKNHVSEAEAIKFLEDGMWSVVGGTTATARDAAYAVQQAQTIVTNREVLLAEAKKELAAAQDNLASVSQPFLV